VSTQVIARSSTTISEPNFITIDQFVQTEMEAIGISGVALAVVHCDQMDLIPAST
jgi:hypothetical protein